MPDPYGAKDPKGARSRINRRRKPKKSRKGPLKVLSEESKFFPTPTEFSISDIQEKVTSETVK